MTQGGAVHDPWTHVDGLPDPARMVGMLEDRAAHPDQVEMRRRFWEWLEVRPGEAVLDVGCGTGVWAREAAAMVSAGGRVLGVDPSRVLVEAARRLARERGAPPHLAFEVVEGAALPFPDESWDLALAATLLTHVQGQTDVMREMSRVARRAGRVAVFDQDLETFVVNHSNRDLTRRFMNLHCDGRADGWSGRRVLGLMRQAGLTGVRCLPLAWVDPDYGPYMRYSLQGRAAFAVERGAATEAEAKAWLDELEGRARDGTFFGGLTYYGFVGTR
jgi:SAM-dependent methyltransferase